MTEMTSAPMASDASASEAANTGTDNFQVSDPVDTSSGTVPSVVNQEAVAAAQQPAANDATQTPPETPPATPPAETEVKAQPFLTREDLETLAKAQSYQPSEVDVDIFDEFGSLDPAKFAAFMIENNQRVMQQATNAVETNARYERIETQAWESVKSNYPEISDNPTLEQAVRGARIQDILSGGDGDLNRLAKSFIDPIRRGKIQAVEDTNRQVTEQEQLQTFRSDNAVPAPAAKPLMNQLREALAAGDTERANHLRHAIRKERIYGTTDNVK